nr:cytochrome P450 [Actinomycetota bacterium]NIT94797.1 cytochrome P450 [Actinomycetota bacterium]NIU18465.1 cytochrome P450 [Actinomycetota bacterium]NIV54922.1 cytochrome P450 [Actinomycetota bacterium]NIV86267.1 cytochrome P450 [Actinomycetota bacterium]
SRDPRTFSSYKAPRPKGNPLPMMISMDDPDHLNRRKLVNRGFTPRRVRDELPKVGGLCDMIIDRVCERGECDFVWDIAAPLPLMLIGDMLGFPRDAFDDLLEWSDDLIRGTTTTSPEASEKATRAGMAFREFQMGVIADRRANPGGDDLVSILCEADVDGDRLDDESIVQESLLILIGGDETTRHVITGGMQALLEFPGEKERLEADLEGGIETAVEEMLRWVTPIKNMARTTMADVEVHGTIIPEGSDVIMLYPSANRDEAVFDDPFRFDVTREPNHHLSFGFGTHFCLGASLARLELREMFARVLTRMPGLEPTVPMAELPWRNSNFITGVESMPVRFTPTEPVGASS